MLAVISDSHIPRKASSIPREFLEIVEKSDTTVHCGDFETRETYEVLEEKAETFVAVMGNCDRFQLDDYRSFEYRDVSFGVTHGKGINPRGHRPTLARIADQLEVDVLFHGHTHVQEAVEHGGKVLLNPGSCTGAPGGSYRGGNPEMMTLRVEEELEAELIELVDDGLEIEKNLFEL